MRINAQRKYTLEHHTKML